MYFQRHIRILDNFYQVFHFLNPFQGNKTFSNMFYLTYRDKRKKCTLLNKELFVLFCFLIRVERKERARLKTVKFNAKPGVIDSKGVGTK